jgi:RNA polymerase sigma factor (sigma-70 family)
MPASIECLKVVDQAVDGDQLAWAQLVRLFGRRLRTIAGGFRLTAAETEDAMQMTWLGLVQNIDKLQSRDKVGAWLSTTMRRHCLRIVRNRRAAYLAESLYATAAVPVANVEDLYLVVERDRQLWEIVGRLPPRQADLVRALFAERPLSYHEIAVVLAMPVGTIGPVRQRALRKLADLLADRKSANDLAPSA